jgi:hypothetical protein
MNLIVNKISIRFTQNIHNTHKKKTHTQITQTQITQTQITQTQITQTQITQTQITQTQITQTQITPVMSVCPKYRIRHHSNTEVHEEDLHFPPLERKLLLLQN